MQPFNLEAAKAGKKVVTKDGRIATYFHWSNATEYPLIMDIDGMRHNYSKDGIYDLHNHNSVMDLFMDDETAPKYSAAELLLLDEFAGKVLIGILAAIYPNGGSQTSICDTAYRYAATMIVTRKKYISCSQ